MYLYMYMYDEYIQPNLIPAVSRLGPLMPGHPPTRHLAPGALVLTASRWTGSLNASGLAGLDEDRRPDPRKEAPPPNHSDLIVNSQALLRHLFVS